MNEYVGTGVSHTMQAIKLQTGVYQGAGAFPPASPYFGWLANVPLIIVVDQQINQTILSLPTLQNLTYTSWIDDDWGTSAFSYWTILLEIVFHPTSNTIELIEWVKADYVTTGVNPTHMIDLTLVPMP